MNLEHYFANMLSSIVEINIKLDKNRISIAYSDKLFKNKKLK